jgi:aldehyde:ferredoxin oxidoreductase
MATEAYDCLSVSAFRAAVILARAVIEATARDQGINEGNLVAKIDELNSRGLIRTHIKEVAHEVRSWGNDAVHVDLAQDNYSEEEAAEILNLADEVLAEVYQSPARVERARQRRLARKAGSGT